VAIGILLQVGWVHGESNPVTFFGLGVEHPIAMTLACLCYGTINTFIHIIIFRYYLLLLIYPLSKPHLHLDVHNKINHEINLKPVVSCHF